MKYQAQEQFKSVPVPGMKTDIVASGMVSDVVLDGSKVTFSIMVPATLLDKLDNLLARAKTAALKVDGIEDVMLVLISDKGATSSGPRAPPKIQPKLGRLIGRDMGPAAGAIPGVQSILAWPLARAASANPPLP